jgi:GNAT superfamily N-acetyltransferase
VTLADIRGSTLADLELLDRRIPSGGRTSFHRQRFDEQLAGTGIYLIASIENRPVGHLLIRWTGCVADEVRRATSACPELNALGVWPPELQRQGIGSQLIRHAEQLAASRGHLTIGLGVADDNPDAARLYERLGYTTLAARYTDRWSWIDHQGHEHGESQSAVFLVKHIAEAAADWHLNED